MIKDIRDIILTHAAYQRLFDTPDGEVVLRHILKQGYVFKSTFVRNDPHETALNEGSRRLALSILKFARRDHAKLMSQITEGITDDVT